MTRDKWPQLSGQSKTDLMPKNASCKRWDTPKVSQGGGSLRDVQELAGPISLAMTPRSIDGDTEAKRKLVALL